MGEGDDVDASPRDAGDADQLERAADQRSRAADERDLVADERDALADERHRSADERERTADDVEDALRRVAPVSAQWVIDALAANARARAANRDAGLVQDRRAGAASSERDPGWEPDKRDFVAHDQEEQADRREVIADERERLADLREEILRDLAVEIGLDTAVRDRRAALFPVDDHRIERDQARTARGRAERARRRAAHDLAVTHRSAFAAQLVAVAGALVHGDSIDAALDEVVQAATRTIDGCDAATFAMVAPGGKVATTASSDPAGPTSTFESAQYRRGEGPGLEAIAAQAVVTSGDVGADPRWPALAEDTAGCHSVLSVPVTDERRGVVLGCLNHYGYAADAFDDVAAESAVLLAAHLGAVLALALDAAAAGRPVVELGHALQTRDVIGQAKGILMERQRLTADEAFDVLRRASQRLNRKLVDVADELAQTGTITTEQI